MPRDSPPTRRRPCSSTAATSRRRRTGTAGTTSCARSSRTCSTGTATRCSAGTSRSGTRRTSRCSGRAPATSGCGCTTSPRAAVKDVDPRLAVGGPSSAAAGWVDALLAHARESGAPVDFVSTHTYGSPPLDLRPTLERLRPLRRPPPVDRVGRHADPLQPGQRRHLGGDVPAQRHALGRRPGRRALLLGGQRPLRGARPPAAAAARRLRPDHRRRDREAALPRAPDAPRSATPSSRSRTTATAPAAWSRPGPAATTTAASQYWCGAPHWTSPSWTATRRWPGASGWSCRAPSGRARGDPPRPRAQRLTTSPPRLEVSDWPTDDQWAGLRAADTLTAEPLPLADGVFEIDIPQPGAVLIEVPAP